MSIKAGKRLVKFSALVALIIAILSLNSAALETAGIVLIVGIPAIIIILAAFGADPISLLMERYNERR
jgi:hypothetical protein